MDMPFAIAFRALSVCLLIIACFAVILQNCLCTSVVRRKHSNLYPFHSTPFGLTNMNLVLFSVSVAVALAVSVSHYLAFHFTPGQFEFNWCNKSRRMIWHTCSNFNKIPKQGNNVGENSKCICWPIARRIASLRWSDRITKSTVVAIRFYQISHFTLLTITLAGATDYCGKWNWTIILNVK